VAVYTIIIIILSQRVLCITNVREVTEAYSGLEMTICYGMIYLWYIVLFGLIIIIIIIQHY